MSEIYVADYGMGNLLSVEQALMHCGARRVEVGHDAARLKEAAALVIPGVGAFGDGMQGLAQAQLIEPIKQFAASGRPVLGICLGMQMLASVGFEHGEHPGLGLIEGQVLPIKAERADGRRRKIPSIGWHALHCRPASALGAQWLAPIDSGSVYLVHSYCVEPKNLEHILADYHYQGQDIALAIGRNNICGVQFHPEKSGEVGLVMLQTFISQAAA